MSFQIPCEKLNVVLWVLNLKMTLPICLKILINSTKLGNNANDRNELVSKVLTHLDNIDFDLSNSESDVLGDAYEYLIGEFASGAGKKAGEFYTPQTVSTLLAKIVTQGKDRLRSVYDPTCGSGSLLLRVKREVKMSI
jgi:type I restriction enzyme M protein